MARLSGNILFLAAAVPLMASCLSSTKVGDGQVPIEFRPVMAGEVRSGGGSAFPEDLDFGIWAVGENGEVLIDCAQVCCDDDRWLTSDRCCWPEDNELRFVGFAPFGLEASFDGGCIGVAERKVSGNDMPLYIAEMTSPVGSRSGPVHIVFRPVTCRIDFRVINGLNKDTSVRLEKIVIRNVTVSGSYQESGWVLSDEKSDIEAFDCGGSPEEYEVLESPRYFGTPVDVIPQKSAPVIEVTYSFSTAGSGWLTGQVDCTVPLASAWEPGRHYTYTLTITGTSVGYTVGLNSWSGK